MNALMNISNDDFIRTTEPRHIRASQALWQAIAANRSPKGRDEIYLGKYAGWYAVRDEAFYGEDELTTAPDGTKRAPSGAEVEWVEEPSYFFRLSDWQDRLLDLLRAPIPDFIAPRARRNEVVSFVKGGLKDLSISRTSFKWGVPVPGDAEPRHVCLARRAHQLHHRGRLSRHARRRTIETLLAGRSAHGRQGHPALPRVYWPAFLMAAGLAPPQRVFAHGWWTVEGQKMSKSLGNFITPKLLVEQYGLDPVRYFMLRELPFGSDGDFSHRADGRAHQRRSRQ